MFPRDLVLVLAGYAPRPLAGYVMATRQLWVLYSCDEGFWRAIIDALLWQGLWRATDGLIRHGAHLLRRMPRLGDVVPELLTEASAFAVSRQGELAYVQDAVLVRGNRPKMVWWKRGVGALGYSPSGRFLARIAEGRLWIYDGLLELGGFGATSFAFDANDDVYFTTEHQRVYHAKAPDFRDRTFVCVAISVHASADGRIMGFYWRRMIGAHGALQLLYRGKHIATLAHCDDPPLTLHYAENGNLLVSSDTGTREYTVEGEALGTETGVALRCPDDADLVLRDLEAPYAYCVHRGERRLATMRRQHMPQWHGRELYALVPFANDEALVRFKF
jgi:hypothetical protein